eukprot:tig00020629_g12370.t1
MAANTIEDVYKWMKEVLIPLLTPVDREAEIYGLFQRPLSTIDIRQIRVRPKTTDQCLSPSVVTRIFGANSICFDDWSVSGKAEYREPLVFTDPKYAPQIAKGLRSLYTWRDELSELRASRYWSTMQKDYIDTYGEGGYLHLIDVGIDRQANNAEDVRKRAQAQVEALQEAKWIDDNTRAAAISFALYNKHTNIYTIAELLLEMPTSGFIIPSHSVRPVYIFLAEDKRSHLYILWSTIVHAWRPKTREKMQEEADTIKEHGNIWPINNALYAAVQHYGVWSVEAYFNERFVRELEWIGDGNEGLKQIIRAGRGLGHFIRRFTRHYLISPDELCYLVRQEALLQWEARIGATIRSMFIIGRPVAWMLGTHIDATSLARETKRIFLDFSTECFDFVDETEEAKNYVPRPIDTREIRGLSLDPVTRYPAIVDFVVKNWLQVRVWQWPVIFWDPELSPEKRKSFNWAKATWNEWNDATCWPEQFGPVDLPEDVKEGFKLMLKAELKAAKEELARVEESLRPHMESKAMERHHEIEKARQNVVEAEEWVKAGPVARYLKAMCWDDPIEYLRKIAACGYHLGRVSSSRTEGDEGKLRNEEHQKKIMSELPYLLAQSKHAEFCRRLINAGCLAPSVEELDALDALQKVWTRREEIHAKAQEEKAGAMVLKAQAQQQGDREEILKAEQRLHAADLAAEKAKKNLDAPPVLADPPVQPALYIKPFCLLSRATKKLYISLARAQLDNLLTLLYDGRIKGGKVATYQQPGWPDQPATAPHFTLKLRYLSRLKV